MNNKKIALHRGATTSALSPFTTGSLAILSLGLASNLTAEQDLGSLPDTTVIANRTATSLDKVGSSVSILNIEDLQKQGIRNLDDALKFIPGAISESLGGQRGSSSSFFIRGTKTNDTHIVVDGMRISDANIAFGGFLGSSNLNGLSRIEVLRGPQGALYGGESIGGVVGIYSKKGEGNTGGSLRVEGGSFNTWNTMLALQGESGDFAYSLSLGHESTDNDLPDNSFEMFSHALRIDYAVSPRLNVGLTLRGADSTFDAPAYGGPYSSPLDDALRYTLATVFADYGVNDIWNTKLTIGMYDQVYRSKSPVYGLNPASSYDTDAKKYAIYWDNTLTWNDSHTTVVGNVYENSDFSYSSDYFGITEDARTRDQYGFYLNHIWDVTESFTLTGGLRWEDYDDYGDEVTWRVASAYTIDQTNTTFRASIGKGFRPPSFVDLYGFGGQAPSPGLQAETSLGWDLGVEQTWCDGQYSVGITYFENKIEDAITYVSPPFPTPGYNINAPGTTTTNGIEVSAKAKFLNDRLGLQLAYTWLDKALVEMPKHSLSLRVNGEVTDKLDLGLIATYLDDRAFFGETIDAYTLINLYGNYQVNDDVALNVRLENIFDEDYDYARSSGDVYPGRGRGIFGGVTVKW